ncbi:reverse transcriptase/maturase family protein [uncultured Ruminococcus sp.]|uniref:reverse transcriptase/maturase family protein n=1 Tax=uncultured Ruminococcus sp. TaxID=165186 RepID=UPI0025D93F35|nr:reverse transcriptase/maturase family protein [uncultured Ruminococcus sp.]
MSLLSKLSQRECWESFYKYKSSLIGGNQLVKELRSFIDSEKYIPVCQKIMNGEAFPLPRKSVISKQDTQKKRVVYTYPDAENMVLKLLTYLLLRKYDGLFSTGLYSFRPNKTAKDAIRQLTRTPHIREMYSYKADISNYFNSVPVERLLPMLKKVLSDDEELYAFLSSLLTEPRVIDGNKVIIEEKGIMAGTPLSAFYADLYLMELDHTFAEKNIPYGRYSDDVILFAETEEKCREYADFLRSFITEWGLDINPKKESFCTPDEGWTFLGFSYKSGVIDIAPASVEKMKNKMRRKTRALQRWRQRNELSGEKAALAFIRIFNSKLFECSENSDLTWNKWFFSVINTDTSLRIIDNFAQDCVRFLVNGKRTKSRFNVRYEDIRSLGLRSLVHEYYLKR